MTSQKQRSTRAASAFCDHYQGILRIIDNLQSLLFPAGAPYSATVLEGKIMSRLLISSAVDNFEVFLGDLLYEISIAKPETMKSGQTVSIEEVLECADIEEFVKYVARKKISKLQKGKSQRTVKENPPIASLNVLTTAVQADIEKILQIRHLYTHRNGIVDEKFQIHNIVSLTVGTEYLLSIDEILDRLLFMAGIVRQLDHAAVTKFQLV